MLAYYVGSTCDAAGANPLDDHDRAAAAERADRRPCRTLPAARRWRPVAPTTACRYSCSLLSDLAPSAQQSQPAQQPSTASSCRLADTSRPAPANYSASARRSQYETTV
jgi:hypothetical protein